MRDLQKEFNYCLDLVNGLGIQVGNIENVTINTRAKKRWGQCRYNRKFNTYSININVVLLNEDVKLERLHDTIIHEILHTVDGCLNHGYKWQKLANMVNDCYSCYHIQTTTCSNEKGVDKSLMQVQHSNTYKVVCCGCGYEWTYYRKTKGFDREYIGFRCGCGSKNKFIGYKNGKKIFDHSKSEIHTYNFSF